MSSIESQVNSSELTLHNSRRTPASAHSIGAKILGGTKLTLTAVKAVSSFVSVPFLQPAVEAAARVIEVIQVLWYFPLHRTQKLTVLHCRRWLTTYPTVGSFRSA